MSRRQVLEANLQPPRGAFFVLEGNGRSDAARDNIKRDSGNALVLVRDPVEGAGVKIQSVFLARGTAVGDLQRSVSLSDSVDFFTSKPANIRQEEDPRC